MLNEAQLLKFDDVYVWSGITSTFHFDCHPSDESLK